MALVIAKLDSLGGKPIESLTPAEARLQPTPADAVKALLVERGESTSPELVRTVETLDLGAGLMARKYVPDEGQWPYPLIVYFHGGGFVLATVDTYDASARALANATHSIVLSVEYRKAPEAKFPAAHDDAFAAYRWATEHAAELGASSARLALAGESAGANLALNAAIRARDEGLLAPRHLLLVYPLAGNDLNTDSYREYANAKPLNAAMVPWFLGQYLPEPELANDARINLMAGNLAGLPNTTIVNARIDPLLDDGANLTQALRTQGVSVERRTFEGVTHEFFGMGAVLPEARQAVHWSAIRLNADLFPAASGVL